MHVQLKLVLACEPDAAWRALRSPAVLRELYGPLMSIDRREGPLPTFWGPGDAEFAMKGFGLIPLGRQLAHLEFDEESRPGVRILRDSGRALSGPLSMLKSFNHRMAVSPAPGDPGKTLYRDRLTFAGPIAPVYWYPLWSIWQWRAGRLKDMAPNWAYDPELQEDS